MIYIWIALAVVCVVTEIVTCGLIGIWIAVGAICAMAAGTYGVRGELQIFICIGVSCALMYFVRPYAVTFLHRKKARRNAERIKNGEVRPMYGKIGGEDGKDSISGQEDSR